MLIISYFEKPDRHFNRQLLKAAFLLALFIAAIDVFAQSEQEKLKFAVIALSDDQSVRVRFEDYLVSSLLTDNYDAISSHEILTDLFDQSNEIVSEQLNNSGIDAVLIIGAIDTGPDASISNARETLFPENYSQIQDFIANYRGNNFQTQVVVHVAGYLLEDVNSLGFWQGVLWLDEEVESEQEGIEKLADLVKFNLNQSRNLLRRRLGLPVL